MTIFNLGYGINFVKFAIPNTTTMKTMKRKFTTFLNYLKRAIFAEDVV